MEIWEVIHIRKRRFLSQRQAVIGLPVYLTVVIIILSIGLYFLSGSLRDALRAQDHHQCQEEISRLMTEVAHLYTYADEEAVSTMTLHVPGSVRLLVFGGLPAAGTQILHDSRTSSNYYFVYDDGSIWTGHVQALLCGENASSPAVFTPGTYPLTLKLLDEEEALYVSISR